MKPLESVTFSSTRIPDSAVRVDECVTVLPRAEHHFKDTEVTVDLKHGVLRKWIPQLPQLSSACSGDDLFDSTRRIQDARRCLREKSLVMVLVSVEKDRKSTRLNSSHTVSSYAVFCLK